MGLYHISHPAEGLCFLRAFLRFRKPRAGQPVRPAVGIVKLHGARKGGFRPLHSRNLRPFAQLLYLHNVSDASVGVAHAVSGCHSEDLKLRRRQRKHQRYGVVSAGIRVNDDLLLNG